MEYTPPPRRAIVNYLSQKGSSHIEDLAVIGDTTPEIAESIARDLVFQGRARYLRDEQQGGAKVVIFTDGF
jgi:DeoR/GlpR family transcriptional regulator of sugar metabolism